MDSLIALNDGRPPGFPLTPFANRVDLPILFPDWNGRPPGFLLRLRSGPLACSVPLRNFPVFTVIHLSRNHPRTTAYWTTKARPLIHFLQAMNARVIASFMSHLRNRRICNRLHPRAYMHRASWRGHHAPTISATCRALFFKTARMRSNSSVVASRLPVSMNTIVPTGMPVSRERSCCVSPTACRRLASKRCVFPLPFKFLPPRKTSLNLLGHTRTIWRRGSRRRVGWNVEGLRYGEGFCGGKNIAPGRARNRAPYRAF